MRNWQGARRPAGWRGTQDASPQGLPRGRISIAQRSAHTVPVSDLFQPEHWRTIEGFDFTDITFHRAVDTGAVRIAFNRPEVRNAFRPRTVDELSRALDATRFMTDVGCVLLTGNGPSPKDGGWAFCSGGDQRI